MAEVIDFWPPCRQSPPRQMSYPWEHWCNGEIWLAQHGIDFPSSSNVWHFRAILYQRARGITKARMKAAAKITPKGREIRYTRCGVTMSVVSDTQIAFQFYDGDEPPEPPRQPRKVSLPARSAGARKRDTPPPARQAPPPRTSVTPSAPPTPRSKKKAVSA